MRRLRRAVTAVAAVALLAGCGGTPEAAPPPTASPSSSSPTSPSPSASASADAAAAPERPLAVKKRNEAGAIATVRWFLASMNYAGTSGDTAPFRATYTDFCTRCEAIADGIDETYAAGGSLVDGAWTPIDFQYYGSRQQIGFIDVVINYAPQTLIASADASPDRAPGGRGIQHAFQLEWQGSWRVAALDPDA